MPLTEQQMTALGALDWLLSRDDTDRRTGRTTVLAIAFIRQALRNSGFPVRIWDPTAPEEAQVFLRRVIEGFMQNHGLSFQWENSHTFRVWSPSQDWYPNPPLDNPFEPSPDPEDLTPVDDAQTTVSKGSPSPTLSSWEVLLEGPSL